MAGVAMAAEGVGIESGANETELAAEVISRGTASRSGSRAARGGRCRSWGRELGVSSELGRWGKWNSDNGAVERRLG